MHLSANQLAFVPDYFIVTNLTLISQMIGKVLDRLEQSDVIYINLSSSFDTTNHTIMLHIINLFGLVPPVIKLFDSYLNGC